MHPVICTIGPITVYSYGVMLACAVVVCTILLQRDAKRHGISSECIIDLMFWSVVGGIAGGRLFFIVLNASFFLEYPAEIIMLNRGGLAWQGAFVGGVIAALIIIKRNNLSIFSALDMCAPYIALGQSIGRIGCFLNGCCYGRPVAWGIYFPVHQAHLHPTQLYSSLGLLIIFFILRRYVRISKVPGRVFLVYLVLASVQRFIIEFFRADHTTYMFGLSIFQIVTVCFLLIAAYGNLLITRQSRR